MINSKEMVFRKFLVRKAVEDVHMLKKDRILKKRWVWIWNNIKNEIDYVLRKDNKLIKYFTERFREFELTVDPRVSAQYVPVRDKLTLNLSYLLFHPPYLTACNLIHEDDHKLYH